MHDGKKSDKIVIIIEIICQGLTNETTNRIQLLPLKTGEGQWSGDGSFNVSDVDSDEVSYLWQTIIGKQYYFL